MNVSRRNSIDSIYFGLFSSAPLGFDFGRREIELNAEWSQLNVKYDNKKWEINQLINKSLFRYLLRAIFHFCILNYEI